MKVLDGEKTSIRLQLMALAFFFSSRVELLVDKRISMRADPSMS